MTSFWSNIKRPIMVLAPMEDVTDTVFRQLIASLAPPDVFFTEFTSVNGMFSKGSDIVLQRFRYTEKERPIVAQIWGTDPELFYKAAREIVKRKFDGIDINMGCPEKSVVQHKAGAACIDDPVRAKEIIVATRSGAKSIPVSVKTRLGYKKLAPDWIPFLLEQNLDALTIHGRTAAEMSKVPAHWDRIGDAVSMRNKMKKETVIIGNGDVKDYSDALDKCAHYGTDGAMIGRGIFQNLWAFDKTGINQMDNHIKLIDIMRKHIRTFNETWGEVKNYSILKKYFKIYIHGFPNAQDVRVQLMETRNSEEAEKILQSAIHTLTV